MPPPYDLILADPAWRYKNKKTGGSHTSGSAQKYATMALDDIKAMPVKEIASRNCTLALWGTVPMGSDPYDVMRAWGFRFKTEIFWHKVGRKGTGYWLRGEVEKLLIGIRGKVPAWRANRSNWIEAEQGGMTLMEVFEREELGLTYAGKPGEHSRKPPVFRDLLRDLTPDARRVELFATDRAEGWESYGLAVSTAHNFLFSSFWESLKVPFEDKLDRTLRRLESSP